MDFNIIRPKSKEYLLPPISTVLHNVKPPMIRVFFCGRNLLNQPFAAKKHTTPEVSCDCSGWSVASSRWFITFKQRFSGQPSRGWQGIVDGRQTFGKLGSLYCGGTKAYNWTETSIATTYGCIEVSHCSFVSRTWPEFLTKWRIIPRAKTRGKYQISKEVPEVPFKDFRGGL